MKIILVVCLFLAAALATPPSSITLDTVIRDFTPQTSPDFEAYLGDDRGFVSLTEDADGKPTFRAGATPHTITSLATFQQWYRDTPNVNIRINSQITLDLIAGTNPAVYSYNNQEYFPIDNQGFGNYGGYGHNFHFTTEIHATFTYQGGEQFTFTGDDDVYVYINNHLAIDLGGVHSAEQEQVNLDSAASSLGITIGGTYSLDVFQAERHTTGSTFRMDTSLQLVTTPPSPTNPGSTVYICGVQFDGYCAGVPADECPGSPNFNTFGESKKDLVPGATSFSNFNVVSFGNFNAGTGDVQGRLAVQNTLTVGNGYSVGALVSNEGAAATDLVCPYSLVVGGNANFGSGRIMPDGLTSDNGINSIPEGVFVGGTFTAPSYLQSQVTGTCAGTSGCLNADFTNAQNYYTLLSTQMAAVPSNTQFTVDQSHALNIACSSSSASVNYINIDTNTFNSILSYNTPSNCGSNSAYVFNVQPNADGTDTVTVQGDGQHFTDPSNVVYNFPTSSSKRSVTTPSGLRTINTPNGGIEGSFLGPRSNLNCPTGVNTGITIAGNVENSNQFNKPSCPPPASPPTPPNGGNLCPWFESDCSGLQFPLGDNIGSFRDFNVISFGDFNAVSGDVQGRLAVQGNLNIGPGYSVGDQLQTSNGHDNYLPYSLVVGGNANFVSGAVYPEGNGIPYPGQEEDLFVGGTFTGESDLAGRVLGSCNGVTGCLDTYFNAAKQCYSNYQSSLASNADNVGVNIQYDALELSCNDNTASSYSVTITSTQFASATYYVVDNCNLQATWVINVPGNDNVTFAGDSFPAIGGAVVYNIEGSGRYIIVETQVNGNILAPNNYIWQSGGVVEGKVVIGSYPLALQVNKPDCPNPSAVTVNGVSSSSHSGSNKLFVQAGKNAFIAGDAINYGDSHNSIMSIDSDGFILKTALDNDVAIGTRIYTIISDPTKARVSHNNSTNPNSASTIQITFTLLVIALFVSLF